MNVRPIALLSTGRSGSTLLGRILGFSPAITVLSEFLLSTLEWKLDPEEPLSGPEMEHFLRRPSQVLENVFARDLHPTEVLYRRVEGETPALLLATLSNLVATPEELLDDICDCIRRADRRPFRAHIQSIASQIAANNGTRLWLDRSGGSLGFAKYVRRILPDARYIILTREGSEIADSMSKHAVYQSLRASGTWNTVLADNPRLHGPDSPDSSLQYYARLWSLLTLRGLEALSDVKREDIIITSYEELVTQPAKTVTDLCEFIGVPFEQDWIVETTKQVQKRSVGSWNPANTLLDRACWPGRNAIRRFLRDREPQTTSAFVSSGPLRTPESLVVGREGSV